MSALSTPAELATALGNLIDSGLTFAEATAEFAARRTPGEVALAQRARSHPALDDDLELDDAPIISSDDGDTPRSGFVMTWLWVPGEESDAEQNA